MILYLDTSSLVKLYVVEQGSDEVARLTGDAETLATSVVAFAEARSAFARLGREGVLSGEEADAVRREFLQDWPSMLKIKLLRRVYERAGELTESHALRGFDAIHMASLLELLSSSEEEDVLFSGFDARLNEAVFAVVPEVMP